MALPVVPVAEPFGTSCTSTTRSPVTSADCLSPGKRVEVVIVALTLGRPPARVTVIVEGTAEVLETELKVPRATSMVS